MESLLNCLCSNSLQIYSLLIYRQSLKTRKVDLQAIKLLSSKSSAGHVDQISSAHVVAASIRPGRCSPLNETSFRWVPFKCNTQSDRIDHIQQWKVYEIRFAGKTTSFGRDFLTLNARSAKTALISNVHQFCKPKSSYFFAWNGFCFFRKFDVVWIMSILFNFEELYNKASERKTICTHE